MPLAVIGGLLYVGIFIGKPSQGFRQVLSGLDAGRIGIGTQACGIGRAALSDAIEYAKERIQFGKPIATFQAYIRSYRRTEIPGSSLPGGSDV